MDTNSSYPNHLHKPIPDNCNISLDIFQYFFYRSGKINIYSPDDILLETIGCGIKRSDIESTGYRLKEQMYLLECLLGNLNSKLEFPEQALTRLADLLYRMQRFCREYIN